MSEKTTIGTRIKTVIAYYNLKIGDVYSELGIDRDMQSKYTKGLSHPKSDFLEGFLKKFHEINARWLLTGEGEMLCIKD